MATASATLRVVSASALTALAEKFARRAGKFCLRLAVVAACGAAPVAARADTFVVNVPWDGVDSTPGDRVCETATGNGLCTLRAAVMEANRTPGSRIDLNLVAVLDIPPSGSNGETTGDLNIAATMTIAGTSPAAAVIDANGTLTHDRAIRIEAGVVTIAGVTIQNGNTDTPGSDAAAERGGGIYVSSGSLVLSRSRVLANVATDRGGGLYVEGGSVSIAGCMFDDNRGLRGGGGIFKADGILTIDRSTIGTESEPFTGGNDAERGGGLFDAGAPGSTTVITNSAVIDNSATLSGGGLHLANAGTVTLQNVTISRNRGDGGAGIHAASSGPIRVFNSTIADNRVGVWVDPDAAAPNLFTLQNTILARNFIFVWVPPPGVPRYDPADCSGRIVAIGDNLLGAVTCLVSGAVRVGDPMLGPLQNNGGPTLTHGLLPGSPAIDAVELNGCRDALGAPLTIDQRGFSRPDGGACDLGAFEASAPFQCLYSLGAARVTIPNGGAEGALSVLASGSECAWTATSDADWAVVTQGAGTGAGTVTFTVAPNPGGARAATVSVMGKTAILWQASHEAVAADFNGDRRSDLVVYRPSNGSWYVRVSSSGFVGEFGYRWGLSTDVPAPGDYDGDGVIDLTVYRPSTGHWFILESSTNYTTWDTYQWGTVGDVPVPGDYDGDGRTDVAIYRPSDRTWYVLQSSGGGAGYFWGWRSDFVPVPADYDGDGKTDPAMYNPAEGQWHIRRSSASTPDWSPSEWGTAGDIPVPADYDGDGRSDLAVYRPSTGMWYIRQSSMPFTGVGYAWGADQDIPVPGDYDGDGVADITVYRPSSGHWFVLRSSTAFTLWDTFLWGAPGDLPAVTTAVTLPSSIATVLRP